MSSQLVEKNVLLRYWKTKNVVDSFAIDRSFMEKRHFLSLARSHNETKLAKRITKVNASGS